MFKIGDFSKLSSLSIRMLRHYDKVELLQPVKVDEQSGYRYYSADPMFNIYHVSPAMESDPNKWVTEVCYPVK
ncbi:MerR-like DNA binding protein [Bacillus thuringiensis]|uniref:MerR-like DNA binding protein n=1 Tax=Bacillus thuringiensis TaxID=1428 RepID=A0A4R4BJR3_BACTU|nr:MerR-like DNA binding protein [Bacillus thuringiensis]TCW58365.1 MerR-like DNA binding protein [Bacillus thuringiensis]